MAFLVSFSLDGSSAIAGDTPASTGKVVVSLIAWKSLPRRCGKCERLGVALLTNDSQRARLGVHAFLGQFRWKRTLMVVLSIGDRGVLHEGRREHKVSRPRHRKRFCRETVRSGHAEFLRCDRTTRNNSGLSCARPVARKISSINSSPNPGVCASYHAAASTTSSTAAGRKMTR